MHLKNYGIEIIINGKEDKAIEKHFFLDIKSVWKQWLKGGDFIHKVNPNHAILSIDSPEWIKIKYEIVNHIKKW